MRVLDDRDLPAVLDLLTPDPVGNVFVLSRLAAGSLDPRLLGGEMWGYDAGGRLAAICYAGANLVPAADDAAALAEFADHARRRGRRCSSIVGHADSVAALWRRLRPSWGPEREARLCQPLLAMVAPSRLAPDPQVRRLRPDELDLLLPASVAMFTEEVGVSPLGNDGGSRYRARLRELLERGRSFARVEDGKVVFKADVGAATAAACQLQGVWVEPSWRGRGIAAAAMSAVVAACLQDVAPTVSLYVNDYNVRARRTYQRVGFEQVGTFASILF